ncbi:MAG: hypothetical protein IKJ51_00080, partial [Clostridia bacterium]|nr:hypothetical protein [Clostridia bacterium]
MFKLLCKGIQKQYIRCVFVFPFHNFKKQAAFSATCFYLSCFLFCPVNRHGEGTVFCAGIHTHGIGEAVAV